MRPNNINEINRTLIRNNIPEAPPIIAEIVTGEVDVWFDGSCAKFLRLRNLRTRSVRVRVIRKSEEVGESRHTLMIADSEE